MSGQSTGLPPYPAATTRVLITGFMGAGKTTVGQLLARRLGWEFADSDHLLEAATGQTIAALFADRGEPAFRDLEAATIRDSLTRHHLVLALGGGALERPETRDRLASLSDSVLIFLDAPLDLLVSRCSGQPNAPVRPVLADRARLEQRWTARLPWYRQAHLTVSTVGCSADEVADRIFQAIADRCRGVAGIEPRRRTGVPA